VLSSNNLETFKNSLLQSLTLLRKKRTHKKKAEKFLMKSALNFRTLETRKKKPTISNVKTVAILRIFGTLKRKFLKKKFPKKMSIVTSISVIARRRVSRTNNPSKKPTRATSKNLTTTSPSTIKN
tara:strand:+ start:521 stop:895 length:375 start_codon:yes stop_codon:yes gene_type:complete